METDAHRIHRLKRMCVEVRRDIVEMIYRAKGGHPGGALSAVEIITVLFFDAMRLRPEEARLARAGSLYPLQRPRHPGPLLSHGAERLFPGRRTGHLRCSRHASSKACRQALLAVRGSFQRLAWSRSLDWSRDGLGRQNRSTDAEYLRSKQ